MVKIKKKKNCEITVIFTQNIEYKNERIEKNNWGNCFLNYHWVILKFWSFF